MDRGFLEEMGIEKENINKILDKYHEGIKEHKDSAEKVKTLEAENNSLKEQITQRDKDLKELKKIDAEELQTKITELEQKNKTMQEEHDKEMSETRKNLMLENSLMKANVKNSKAIRGMLELDKITIDGDELTGLDDQIKALKEISLSIPEKSITALIGPSGCGKSTFLKTLNRMNDLVPGVKIEGTVDYEGKNIFDSSVDVNELRREIGMVFQKPNPFPMSIYDNIAYGPRTHGITNKVKLDEIVEKSLRDAAIWEEVKDRLKKNALGLSGGQQQRLCIARALAVEPKVLLMDEPTSALDPISTSRIEELAMELKEKYTIVIVTHNMQQAVRISDYTAFFLLGELVEFGETEKLFSQPRDQRTEDYITGRFG